MNPRQAQITVLIGSPKGIERSASANLARILTGGLDAEQWSREWFHTHQAIRSDEVWTGLVASIRQADVILLATPLYVDSLPAPVIETLYRLSETTTLRNATATRPRMLSVLNCGFVEPRQNRTAQEMVRLFCEGMGFDWAGGISVAAGGTVTQPIRGALETAAAALRDGVAIPDTVALVTDRPVMPSGLYVLGGNFMWKRQAKANGVRHKLHAQPYKRT